MRGSIWQLDKTPPKSLCSKSRLTHVKAKDLSRPSNRYFVVIILGDGVSLPLIFFSFECFF